MKYIILLLITIGIAFTSVAQQKIKLDYISKVPAAFRNCGALYTYDSVALQKKKYILAADFQNQALVSIDGKIVKLLLTGTSTTGKINTSTYNGDGYTITINYHTVSQNKKYDLEAGSVIIAKGNRTLTVNIHGQSSCDESKQEGNSK